MGDDVERAIEVARSLLARSHSGRRHARFGRLVADDDGKRLAIGLADQVLRIRDDGRAAARFRALVAEHGVPRFAGALDRTMLRAGAVASKALPSLVMPLVRRRIRSETGDVIISAHDPELGRHLARRRADDIDMNVNLLGEAILGEDEAQRRLDATIELAERDDVDYVSVKLSAICSQLNVVAFDETVALVTDRLGALYARCAAAGTFVNLDMEEYRDLQLTTAAFMRVLDEPPLDAIDAGIVLQAYLPDSHGVLADLGRWAMARHERAGGRVKVRIVKGANLAMERVEAELRGWEQAPYETKAEVDASYKRLLADAAAFAPALWVGAASHNLFDVAWALERGVEIEMLEGMAPAQAEAVRDRAGRILLYAPVVRRTERDSAIAYLVRRLEENAAPENFLRHLFAGGDLAEEQAKFERAVHDASTVSTSPRRIQVRADVALDAPFTNEPDLDFTLPVNRDLVRTARTHPRFGDVSTQSTASWHHPSRAGVINEIGNVVARRRGEAIAVMARETGKTVGEGDPEVSEAIDFCRWYARHAIDDPAFSPYGTVVVASPWNFPLAIPMGGVTAALAAGNRVILKPAPEAVEVGRFVAECCWEAGVPADALDLAIVEDGEEGQRLIESADAVVLTGSYETAQLFLSWRPDLHLHAETSGKNAMVITASADIDLAVRDLVRSAFGHAGQKCSAASLAIVESSVHDDPRFTRQLADAVRSLPVGPATDLTSIVGPLVQPPEGRLLDALTTLQPGESWLVEPRRLAADLWRPGVKLGVQPGSPFHQTEVFGPVLGIMEVGSLEEAVAVQNGVPFGLTAGLHTLDDGEVEWWLERVEAGNLYVNRHITGAIVRRQPFGGWKRSVVGPTVKAGGPDYVASLGTWQPKPFDASTWSWAVPSDPSGLTYEANVLRYRPLPNGVCVHGDLSDDERGIVEHAASVSGTPVRYGLDLTVDRLRVPHGAPDDVLRAAHEAGVVVDPQPITGDGRVELLHWLREQAISRTLHRFGNLV